VEKCRAKVPNINLKLTLSYTQREKNLRIKQRFCITWNQTLH